MTNLSPQEMSTWMRKVQKRQDLNARRANPFPRLAALETDLAAAQATIVTLTGASKGAVSRQAGIVFGPGSSLTYVNYGASVAYTKNLSAAVSKLRVAISITGWTNNALGTLIIGVRIGSTDYDITRFYFNDASKHATMYGVDHLTGIAAGALTIQPRYKATSPTTFQSDVNDLMTVEISEVLV